MERLNSASAITVFVAKPARNKARKNRNGSDFFMGALTFEITGAGARSAEGTPTAQLLGFPVD